MSDNDDQRPAPSSRCTCYWVIADLRCDLAEHGTETRHATFAYGRQLIEWPEHAYPHPIASDLPSWVWRGEGSDLQDPIDLVLSPATGRSAP